jgi:hypothetical protein
MEKTTITLGVDTANQLRRFKIRAKAKNLNEVIKILIKTYRECQQRDKPGQLWMDDALRYGT